MKDHGKKLGMVTAAASLAMAAGLASAQCQTATGPDVIVGNIIDGNDGDVNSALANYTHGGGLDATSLGTTSCNVGTVNLNWIASTNQHPVIGGNLFQYREFGNYATLEQVGMSWLKHGFTALTQNLCCTCNGQGGSRLGVGCSDPYTSSRNGGQSAAGPRWQVNASTGFFTYPPANPGYSGNTARRLEFRLEDIVASNTAAFNSGTAVRHLGEAQYVTPDDAAAGNKFNNTSFRRIVMSGSAAAGWNASITTTSFGNGIDAMQRQKSAVEIWPQIDNQVLQDKYIVPNATPIESDPYKGEGKFIVSSRAYDLGDGTWRYEYSIHNQSSHRSAGSFDVPVPAGVNVTNVGFHCPVYRNGDGEGNVNRSSTPWATDMTGGKVGWATQSFNVNINANAIRWGTTYNFRFVADTPPAGEAYATIGLWRPAAPGEPSSFDMRVMAPSAPTGTPCLADWDGDDTVGVPDIFAFLASWFADDVEAQNFGGASGVGAIFAFLSEWFAHGTGPC
jgi:hypothetical protein